MFIAFEVIWGFLIFGNMLKLGKALEISNIPAFPFNPWLVYSGLQLLGIISSEITWPIVASIIVPIPFLWNVLFIYLEALRVVWATPGSVLRGLPSDTWEIMWCWIWNSDLPHQSLAPQHFLTLGKIEVSLVSRIL